MIFLVFQGLLYSFAASLSVLTELEQASIPKWMSVFFELLPRGGCYCEKPIVLTKSQYTN